MVLSNEIICASIFTVGCVFVAFIYRHVCKLYTYFEKLELSGPVPRFLLGTWKESLEKFLGDVDVENSKVFGKVYGTFDGLTPNLMVADPKFIKEILLTHKDKFVDRRITRSNNPVLKKSLAYLYGDEDKKTQALTNSLLSESKLEKLLPRLESTANTLVQNLTKRIEEGTTFNLMPLVNEYIHDVIAFTVFGIDLNADAAVKDAFVGFCDQILTVKNPNSTMGLISFLYEKRQSDNWMFPQRALEYFVDLITTNIKKSPRDPVLTESKAANLVELLIEASEEEKKLVKGESQDTEGDLVLTEEVIAAKCISAILAFINSAKSTILLGLHSLASQTEAQDELSSEVKKHKIEKLSMENLQNVPVLDMIIAEVLRLYPSDFRIEKECKEPVTIEKYNFETGSIVSVPLFALHRHPDHYPEHEKFDPSRFSQEAIENREPFTYLPFGQDGANGYSISIRLALLASKITLLKLIEKFRFKLHGDNAKAVFRVGLTGVPKLAALHVSAELKA